MSVLEIRNLTAGYGGAPVLQDFELSLGAGQAVAIVEPNGAGKSTLMNAIAGLLPVQGGTVLLNGTDVTQAAPERRHDLGLGYAPEGRRIFPGLTVHENLEVAGPPSHAARSERTAFVLKLFPVLEPKLKDRAWTLSGGQQQMLSVGRALMNRPRVLLLDEPSLGLAADIIKTMYDALDRLVHDGTAILLTESAPDRVPDFAIHRHIYEG